MKCASHMKVTPTIWIQSFRLVDFSRFRVMVGWKWSRAIAVLQASLFPSDGCGSTRKVQEWCSHVKNMPLPSQNYRGRNLQKRRRTITDLASQLRTTFQDHFSSKPPSFFQIVHDFFFVGGGGEGGLKQRKKESCMKPKVSPEQAVSGINIPPRIQHHLVYQCSSLHLKPPRPQIKVALRKRSARGTRTGIRVST